MQKFSRIKMKKTITKEFQFDASHRLQTDEISEEMNQKVFGKCYNFPSHGHRYQLFVTVSGKEKYGMIINYTELKRIVNQEFVDIVDHNFLNDLEMFEGKITTCETMVDVIWEILEPHMNRAQVALEEIKLYETPTSYATLKKDD